MCEKLMTHERGVITCGLLIPMACSESFSWTNLEALFLCIVMCVLSLSAVETAFRWHRGDIQGVDLDWEPILIVYLD